MIHQQNAMIMLSGITWSAYCSFMALVLFIYYAALTFFFYRTDVLRFARNQHRQPVNKPDPEKKAPAPPAPEADGLLFSAVHDAMEELKIIFEKGYGREELLQALHSRLKCYGQLNGTSFQSSSTIAAITYLKEAMIIHCILLQVLLPMNFILCGLNAMQEAVITMQH